ncbi:MAG TPA: NAD-dependent deacylase [Candidatus Methylomirabilis sp.]|nr:NAD-dependent deacylase [Candidatus Methylomirabilis sp.]
MNGPGGLRERLARGGRVVVLTGAGVSAESGVPTFRGEGGLWRQYRTEDLATPEGFRRDPALVWEWYDWRRQLIARCEPNPAHHAIAALERGCRDFLLITQNVDGLHRKAGSQRLVELHGNLWRVRCPSEGTITERPEVPLRPIPPRCECGELLRPDVVWFGESLPSDAMREAFEAAGSCDVMLVVGTSALVQPAASLPLVSQEHGAYVVEVNLEPTPLTAIADESHHGRAGEILPRLLGFPSELSGKFEIRNSKFEISPPIPNPRETPCSP